MDTHEWAEREATWEKPVCARNVRQSLQDQASFLLKANVKQVIRSFPHTGYAKRGSLTDLQCDTVLKEKFNSLKLDEFYASLSTAIYPNIQKMAQRMLVLFGSTYVCELTFSMMNTNNASHRSQLSDEHLRSTLRIVTTKLAPDFDALAKKGDQKHSSHEN